jgi:hypothetical protein
MDVKAKWCLAISGAALWAVAAGQTAVYQGGTASETGYRFSAWGDGSAAESTDLTRVGSCSIKVTARGLYQGGMVALPKPVDLAPAAADPYNLLVFSVAIPQLASGTSGGVSGGDEGPPRARRLRVVLEMEDGTMTEIRFVVLLRYHSYQQWHNYAIPVSRIPKLPATNARVSRLGFFADAPVTYYVGEVTVISDRTPITGEIVEMGTNLARDDEPLFVGVGSGGNTPLKYYWDWDASDGVQRESEGGAVYHMFRVPGEYTITLEIADEYGIKESATTTIKITVNP